VRDVADKVAPDRLQPPDVRQVLQDDEIAGALLARGKRCDDTLQERLAAEFDGGALLAAPIATLLPEVHELMVAGDLDKGPANRRLSANLQKARGSRVRQRDVALVVEDQRAVGHVVEHGAHSALLHGQRIHLLPQLCRHAIECPGQPGHFVLCGGPEARPQVARCKALCQALELADRLGGAIRHNDGRHQRHRDGDQRGGQGHSPQPGQLRIDLADRDGYPHDGDGGIGRNGKRCPNRDCHVQHPQVQSVAVAHGAPEALAESLLDLGAQEVAGHRPIVLVGVAQDSAVQPDERNAGI